MTVTNRVTGVARSGRLLVWAAPLGVAGLWLWDPATHGGPTLCPLRAATGVPCPGCGVTRALGALTHARWHEAVVLHPLAPLVALVLVGCWAHALARRVGAVAPMTPRARRVTTALAVAGALVTVGVWVLRLAHGDLANAA